MACRLFGTNPLSEPELSHCQFGPLETNFREILIKIRNASGNIVCEKTAILYRGDELTALSVLNIYIKIKNPLVLQFRGSIKNCIRVDTELYMIFEPSVCTILALDLFVTINLFYNPCIRLPIKPFMYLWHQDYENKVISYRVMATGISEVHMAAILEIYCLGPQSTFYLLATSESSWDITGTLKPFRDLVRSCWVALETISHAGLFISHSDIGNDTSLVFLASAVHTDGPGSPCTATAVSWSRICMNERIV